MSKIIKNGVTYGGMPTVSGNISYDNTSSGLNAITVQNAITELKEIYDLPKGYAWAGTQDEWDALSVQEKQIYDDKVVLITDDVENSFQRTLLYDSGSYDTGAAFQTDVNLLDNLSNYDIGMIVAGISEDNDNDNGYGEVTVFFDCQEALAQDTFCVHVRTGTPNWLWVQFTDTTFRIGDRNASGNKMQIFKIYGYKFKGTVGTGGGSGNLTAADVAFSDTTRSASIYTNVTNVEEALMAIKSGINAIPVIEDAGDVSFTDSAQDSIYENVTNVEDALLAVKSTVSNLNATDIALTGVCGMFVSCDNVREALDVTQDVLENLDTGDVDFPSTDRSGIYANVTTAQAAFSAIKTAISSGGGGSSSSATNVSFTKPQGGIYSSGTDNVQEALEDVSAKVLDLAASDIAYVNGCGGSYPTEVETVHDALECLQHLLLKYSEFEEETGWLWFNDKPIYQISVKEIESGTTNLFDTNELKIDDLVYMEATLTDSSGAKRWTISGSSGELYWNTTTHMIVYGGSDVITTATIRYTKTSD